MSELAYQMGWKAGLERGKSERDALQARVAKLEGAMKWRPIETAPKDGSYILAISEKKGMSRIPNVLCWNEWFENWGDGPSPESRMVAFEPTHWMPIPTHRAIAEGESQ